MLIVLKLAPRGVRNTALAPIRSGVRLTWAIVLFGVAVNAAAEGYPPRTIRIVVPYTTGGGTDVMERVIAADLSKMLGQAVIVENKPGAGGVIGTDVVAKARPDGYTIGLISSGLSINPAMYRHMPFNAITGITPMIHVASGPNVIVVNAAVPAKSLTELIELATADPGSLTFGSAGSGSPGHLAAEEFQYRTGTNLVHVPYKGIPDATVDLLAGRIDLMFGNIPALLPHIRSGKPNTLAVTRLHRSPVLPGVPTMSEAGLPGFEQNARHGLMAPAGTRRRSSGGSTRPSTPSSRTLPSAINSSAMASSLAEGASTRSSTRGPCTFHATSSSSSVRI